MPSTIRNPPLASDGRSFVSAQLHSSEEDEYKRTANRPAYHRQATGESQVSVASQFSAQSHFTSDFGVDEVSSSGEEEAPTNNPRSTS